MMRYLVASPGRLQKRIFDLAGVVSAVRGYQSYLLGSWSPQHGSNSFISTGFSKLRQPQADPLTM
jgi:hypothetical protein